MKREIKKIMLIYPPVSRPKDFSAKVVKVSSFLPLGIAYIAAYLERFNTYELKILDALIEGDIFEGTLFESQDIIRYGLIDDTIAEIIKKFSPDVIGVACLFSAMEWDAVNVCRLAKGVNPGIVTIMGGAHAGAMAEEILVKSSSVDYVIIGEAEKTFHQIISAIDGSFRFSDLDGVALREDGLVKVLPKTRYIENLDELPFPARHLFPVKKYFEFAPPHGSHKYSPYTQIISSRGCPCKCTFCALGNHWGSKQRMRSAKNVVDEIQYLVTDYAIREIHFEDDNLTADKKRAIAIFEGIIGRKLNISWCCPSGMAVYTLDKAILSKMKESGCYSITLAIESGNQQVITKLMNKPVNLAIVPDLVKEIRKAGMDVRGFFIIGYPDETKDSMRQTIEFAKKLELDWAYFSIASPIPHTEMYDLCLKKKYMKAEDFDPVRSFHKCIIRTPEFTPEYLMEFREEAIVDVNFRNNPNLLKYDIDKAIENFKEVVNRYPHFDFANFYLGEAYLKKGDKNMAIDSYKRTLSLNSSHKVAKDRMKELNSSVK